MVILRSGKPKIESFRGGITIETQNMKPVRLVHLCPGCCRSFTYIFGAWGGDISRCVWCVCLLVLRHIVVCLLYFRGEGGARLGGDCQCIIANAAYFDKIYTFCFLCFFYILFVVD